MLGPLTTGSKLRALASQMLLYCTYLPTRYSAATRSPCSLHTCSTAWGCRVLLLSWRNEHAVHDECTTRSCEAGAQTFQHSIQTFAHHPSLQLLDNWCRRPPGASQQQRTNPCPAGADPGSSHAPVTNRPTPAAPKPAHQTPVHPPHQRHQQHLSRCCPRTSKPMVTLLWPPAVACLGPRPFCFRSSCCRWQQASAPRLWTLPSSALPAAPWPSAQQRSSACR